MAVIPLTLIISLCLVFTFVIFFFLEHSRNRFGSAESHAILPLAEETPRVVHQVASARRVEKSGCGCAHGVRPACDDCLNHPAS